MTLNNLTGTYHVTVTPGSGNYASSLNIAQTGVIEPVAIGANGIYLAPGIIGSTIYNFGVVRSGNGSGTVASGDGVLLEASATLFNHGTISSGSTANRSSPGGIGVDLAAGGNLINDGVINGSYGLGGGTGVLLALGGNITNSDYISGGGGRFGAGGP